VRLFRNSGGTLPTAFLDLRQAARVLTNTKNGTLEGYAATLDGAPMADLPQGRAGRRLGMLIGMLQAWRALPRDAHACPTEEPMEPPHCDTTTSRLDAFRDGSSSHEHRA
jgi:hypothetical protein